jgi:hypothetical protein
MQRVHSDFWLSLPVLADWARDFAQIEQGVLDVPAAAHPPVLDNPVIAMLLAVFDAFGLCEEHDSIVKWTQSNFKNQGLYHSAKRMKSKETSMVFMNKCQNWSF